ncbi:unnamed protein product [Musa banksii]
MIPRRKPMAALLLPLPNSVLLRPPAACTSLLDKCSDVEGLKQIHATMVKTGLVLDAVPASRLLAALCRSPGDGSLTYALLFFERLRCRNTFMWNTMIRALSDSNLPEQAVILYCQMRSDAMPHNPYTFPFLLKACVALPSALPETQQVHSHIIKHGFASEVYTANSLLRVYAKSGCTGSARKLFDRMPCRDAITWNSMIDGYAKSGRLEMALRLFDLMEEKNVVSWTSMITGCVENCLFKEALELFGEMLVTEVEADARALTSALTACTHLGALDQGRWIHTYIKKRQMQLDPALGCVLVDMYAKCGELDEALSIFEMISERNVAVWTAMIAGLAVHGLGREALDLFKEMEEAGVKPNHITVTSALTACSYAGMVEEGGSLFERITKEYNMSPSVEHYGCMVDVLGRAGMLKEAEDLINAMPFDPNAAVWGALANACRIHRNFELGKHVGKMLIELEPEQSGRYIQLASILAAEGSWKQSLTTRKLMRERGVLKLPGCSSISVKGSVHEFVVGDRSHPQAEKIHLEWERILRRLRKEGYVASTDQLLLDLEEEEKEAAVGWHSEKLAIAFGFISTEPGTTIRIVKNLRVCADCHAVSKLISKVYRRKIVMRDRARFHVFVDGTCSCKDYW